MGIKGLTGRGAALPQVGTLRKGGPSVEKTNSQGKKYNSYGKDLEGFRFDTDDAEALERFTTRYGDEPRSINVYLPYPTAEENFWTCKEAWSASALQHRCDGETCSRWLDKKTGKYRSDPVPCPGGCKEVGRLKVIIPDLRRMVYVVAETHSLHDIINLDQQLAALEGLRGSLRGIPMILSRSPREISTPRENGARARVTKWLMSIEAAPSWVEYQLQAMERQALPDGSPAPLALPAPQQVLETDEYGAMDIATGEVVEEAPEQPAQPAVDKTKYIASVQLMIDAAVAIGIEVEDVPSNFDTSSLEELGKMGKTLRKVMENHLAALHEEAGVPVPGAWPNKPSELKAMGLALIATIERQLGNAKPSSSEPQQEVIPVDVPTKSRYADGQLAL